MKRMVKLFSLVIFPLGIFIYVVMVFEIRDITIYMITNSV